MVEIEHNKPTLLADPTEDERTLAFVCHLSILFGSVVVPLVVLITRGHKSPFVAFHARQALVFQVSALVLLAVTMCLTAGLGGVLLVFAPLLGVVWGMRARAGQTPVYPVVGAWALKHGDRLQP